MPEQSGADMLAAWLAEDRNREANIYAYSRRQWRCRLIEGKTHYTKDRFTPDAAMRAAVEKAKESNGRS